ncbi:hypothetical protein [Leptospira sarikeiensis]|uniref:DUF2079 domain-containing protein n=1 Tax=Leptospira sarikeiensis TaxID=2484943 RepID=A0A4R9K0W0_9LEPT|nr:hypothetical protein [Leptospira sarikeiensis]TGL57669.1 hypothetical protein EHQ64_19965 [Leptospira sarikeiensis]
MDFLKGLDLKNRIFFFSVSLLGFLGFVLSLGRVTMDPSLAGFFYNSDSLFFSIIYQELFLKPGANFLISLKDLGWTPAPYFFPDLVQYFALRTIYLPLDRGAWEWTHLSYAIFQWTLLLSGILFFLQKVRKEKLQYEGIFLTLGFGYFVGIILILYKIDLFVFLPGFHGGNLAVLSWAWAFFHQWEERNSGKDFILVFVSVFLFSLSDLLFIPCFLVPTLGVHFCQWFIEERSANRIKKIVYLYFPVVLGIVFSRFFFQWIRKISPVFFPGVASPQKIGEVIGTWKLEDFAYSLTRLWKENWIYLVCILAFFLLIKLLTKKEKFQTDRSEYLFLVLGIFTPFVLLIYGFVFGLAGKQGIQEIDRYFGQILLGFLGIGFVFILRFYQNGFFKFGSAILLLLVILFSIQFTYRKGLGIEHYPNKVACLDQLSESKDWKRGIASFWYVRPMRIFSKRDLQPDDYLYDLMLFYWQNNLSWFERETPAYTFAIVDGIDEKILKKKLGEPSSITYCDGIPIYSFDRPEKSSEFIKENRNKIDMWRISTSRY